MRKYQLRHNFLSILSGFCLIVTACSTSATPLSTQSVGNISDIKNVIVSKPDESEIDQLTTISKLPVNDCIKTNEGEVCSISASQIIKWGWGFCENDEAALRANLPNSQVELIVDDIRIPNDFIYQRDETYDRQQNAYCHTWSTKLSKWQTGKTVQLVSRVYTTQLGPQNNIFVINVK